MSGLNTSAGVKAKITTIRGLFDLERLKKYMEEEEYDEEEKKKRKNMVKRKRRKGRGVGVPDGCDMVEDL